MKDALESITLSQLKNFHKLAETKHFTDAARQLYITQPTLSVSIKSLEKTLGVSLFFREGRRNVRLTKYGEQFKDELDHILSDLEEAVLAIKQDTKDPAKTLTIGTIPTIQYSFLPNLLRLVWDTYGYSSKIKITVEFSGPLIDGLKNQDYELAFCANVPEEHDLEFIPMIHLPLVATVNKNGPYKDLKRLSLADLPQIPFATYSFDTPIGRETYSLLKQFLQNPTPVVHYDDEFMLSSAVSIDKNIIGLMLNTFEIDPFTDLDIIPIEEVPEDWHAICLACDKRIQQSQFAQDFIDKAREFSKTYVIKRNAGGPKE